MRSQQAATGKPYTGPPMTLDNAATARVRLIVWRKDCGHQVEPDLAQQAQRDGAETTVPDWRDRSGAGRIDMVVTGTERR